MLPRRLQHRRSLGTEALLVHPRSPCSSHALTYPDLRRSSLWPCPSLWDSVRFHTVRSPPATQFLTFTSGYPRARKTYRNRQRCRLERIFKGSYPPLCLLPSRPYKTAKRTVQVQIGVIQFYFLTHLSLKLSIMLQYYRVAVLPWEKRLCLVIIAILSAGYLAFLLVQMVRCIPFEAQWNPKYPGARCIYSTAAFFAAQGFNLGLDLLILVGPLFILRHSSAPLPQKMLFGIALAFGGA